MPHCHLFSLESRKFLTEFDFLRIRKTPVSVFSHRMKTVHPVCTQHDELHLEDDESIDFCSRVCMVNYVQMKKSQKKQANKK